MHLYAGDIAILWFVVFECVCICLYVFALFVLHQQAMPDAHNPNYRLFYWPSVLDISFPRRCSVRLHLSGRTVQSSPMTAHLGSP